MNHTQVISELHHTEYHLTKLEVEELLTKTYMRWFDRKPEAMVIVEESEEEENPAIEGDGFKETNGEEQ